MFSFFKEPKFNFQAIRRLFLVVSGLAMAAGVYSIVYLAQGKANLGTDFGGGVLLHLTSTRDLKLEDLRTACDKAGYKDAQIQKISEPGMKGFKAVVRIRRALDNGVGTLGLTALADLQKQMPDSGLLLEGSEEVGPAVSAKLRDDAIKAFLLSMLGILVYIAYRFDFRFGIISVIATVHDILVMMAFLILGGFEFNLLSITAILTISGYSLNDTVVIFDRIRENMKLVGRMNYPDMINLSLNETLNRTVNTGGTVLVSLIPVYAIGGEVLHDFSLALIVGVLVGTYSSIFVAAATLTEWHLAAMAGKTQAA